MGVESPRRRLLVPLPSGLTLGVTIPQEAWDVLEAGFDAVDADGDGELTAEEIGAAFPPPKKGKKGPKGGALLRLKSKLRNMNKNKNKAKQGGLNEVEAFMAEQLADEGTITKEEAHAFAVEMGVPESMMDELEAGFDAVDANGDGNSMPEKLRLPWSTWVLTR